MIGTRTMKKVSALAMAAVVLVAAMVLAATPGKAYADIVAPTNYTANGSSVTWSISDDGVLTIKPTSGDRGVLKYNTSNAGTITPPWFSQRANIKSVSVEGAIELQGNMYGMFWGCSSLTSLDLSHFDTSKVTNMSKMFQYCISLTSLNWSSSNTSNVTNMSSMFSDCSSLTSLDLSHFNTSNVTDMNGMFQNCTSLASLNVSHFNTANVTHMNNMFQDCTNLISLDLSGFDNSNLIGMYCMFYNCSSLTSLDLSSFNTSSVKSMSNTFAYCSSLTSLDLSSFNTSSVTNMSAMFSNCTHLTSLDLTHFNTSNVTDMGSMFYNCCRLTSLDVSNFNTANVVNMSKMFSDCYRLTSLDLSAFDMSKITGDTSNNGAYFMLAGMYGLKTLTVGSNFKFTGWLPLSARTVGLPEHIAETVDDVEYTANWVKLGDTSAAGTAATLMSSYGAAPFTAGTYVWERVDGVYPSEGDDDNDENGDDESSQTGHGASELVMIAEHPEELSGTDDEGNPLDAAYEIDGTKVGSNLAFTVPSAINYVVAADGKLTGPTNAYVGNASAYAIHVSSLEATAAEGWTFVADADAATAKNSVELHIGPAGNMANVADFANGKKAVEGGSAWEMAARYVDTTANLPLVTEGEARLVDADITSLTQFGTLRWYLTAGPAAA